MRKQERILDNNEKAEIRKKAAQNPKYFKRVNVSVTAAAKMLKHAHYGLPNEIMGLLQGSFHEQKGVGVFYIEDIISLPVDNTETRVTASSDASILMAIYSEWVTKINTHDIVGWYHSHPDYGCWLSGIDVNTQELYQKNTDPFLAIVVDPINSSKLQKIDIGAFRTYPPGYKNQDLIQKKDVPRKKDVDYGYHSKKYYQLPVSIFAKEEGMKVMKKVQKAEWADQIAYSSFFKQINYLIDETKDEKLDFKEYIQMKESLTAKASEVATKEKNTLKKISYYSTGRNIPLLDSAMKALLF